MLPIVPRRWLRGGSVVHRVSVVRDTYDCKSINVAWSWQAQYYG
jgi:hypothetical protein